LQINVHLSAGIILTIFLRTFFFQHLSHLDLLLIVGISILIDFDFIFSRFAKDYNHRRLPTHGFPLYLILMGFGVLLAFFNFPWLLYAGLAGLVHVSLDLIDWGTCALTPIKRDLLIGGTLKPPSPPSDPPRRVPQCYFTMTYYHSKIILVVEVAIFFISLILLLLFDFFSLYLLIGYGLFLGLHLLHYLRCRREKEAS